MVIITTFIGLILVYLILSLLASSIQETFAGWFSLRAKTMGKALERMLTNGSYDNDANKLDKSILNAFENHSIYGNLMPERGWYHRLFGNPTAPSYMTAKTFADIMLHTLDGTTGQKLESAINDMDDGRLKDYLQKSLADVNHDVAAFRTKMEDWYDGVMDRASGWYKRNVHNTLLVIGLLVAAGFNADTFTMYNKISAIQPGSAEETAINSLANQFVNSQFNLDIQTQNAASQNISSLDSSKKAETQQLKTAITTETELKNQIESLRETLDDNATPLGLGWSKEEWNAMKSAGFLEWLEKILGFIITAFAISLGAPFWFDMLRKIINIRNAGPIKSVIPPTPASAIPPTPALSPESVPTPKPVAPTTKKPSTTAKAKRTSTKTRKSSRSSTKKPDDKS